MESMDSVEKRSSAVAAKTFGDTVNPVVTGLITSAAIATQNPQLAFLAVPAGAFAGAIGEQAALLVDHTIRDRVERVRRLTEFAEDAAGQPFTEFIDTQVDGEKKRDLLNEVVSAAVDAKTAWKIRLLAQSFVHGSKDITVVDETLWYVKLLSQIEQGHARFLAAVSHLEMNKKVATDAVDLHDIVRQDPGIESVAPFVLQDLGTLGLIIGEKQFHLTPLGGTCCAWLAKFGSLSESDTA